MKYLKKYEEASWTNPFKRKSKDEKLEIELNSIIKDIKEVKNVSKIDLSNGKTEYFLKLDDSLMSKLDDTNGDEPILYPKLKEIGIVLFYDDKDLKYSIEIKFNSDLLKEFNLYNINSNYLKITPNYVRIIISNNSLNSNILKNNINYTISELISRFQLMKTIFNKEINRQKELTELENKKSRLSKLFKDNKEKIDEIFIDLIHMSSYHKIEILPSGLNLLCNFKIKGISTIPVTKSKNSTSRRFETIKIEFDESNFILTNDILNVFECLNEIKHRLDDILINTIIDVNLKKNELSLLITTKD